MKNSFLKMRYSVIFHNFAVLKYVFFAHSKWKKIKILFKFRDTDSAFEKCVSYYNT